MELGENINWLINPYVHQIGYIYYWEIFIEEKNVCIFALAPIQKASSYSFKILIIRTIELIQLETIFSCSTS